MNFTPLLRPIMQRFPHAVRYYRHLREGYYVFAEPVMTPLGFRLAGDPRMESGTYERLEVEIVRRCLAASEVFINVGAHIGYYACLALSLGKTVVAFEPLDVNLKLLYQNIAANGWQDQVEIYPVALSDRTGLVELHGGHTGASLIPGWAGALPHHRRWAPTSTLDLILGERFSGARCFILADVEGAEFSMLQGATCLLTQTPRPIWMIEIQGEAHQPDGIGFNPHFLATFQLFWEHGYHAWTVESQPRRVDEAEIEHIWRTRRNTLPVHNFFFVQAGEEPPHA